MDPEPLSAHEIVGVDAVGATVIVEVDAWYAARSAALKSAVRFIDTFGKQSLAIEVLDCESGLPEREQRFMVMVGLTRAITELGLSSRFYVGCPKKGAPITLMRTSPPHLPLEPFPYQLRLS